MSVFDAKDFLTTELGFTPEEAAELAPKFSGERETKLKGAVLRQRDYSQKMDAEAARIKTIEERLEAEAAEWASLTATEKAAAGDIRKQLEDSQRELLRHQQAFTRVAQEAGVDPKTYLDSGGAGTPPVTPPATPAIDTSKFASADQQRALAQMALRIPAQIASLTVQHRALTGEDLDPTALVDELERRASTKGNTKPLDLKSIWEEQHDIPNRRAAVDKAKFDTAIADAEKRGREAALSEASLPPGAMPTGKHSPVFAARESKVSRPQPGVGLQSAIAAFRTGKYRQGGSQTT
jgi:hypothetical protein